MQKCAGWLRVEKPSGAPLSARTSDSYRRGVRKTVSRMTCQACLYMRAVASSARQSGGVGAPRGGGSGGGGGGGSWGVRSLAERSDGFGLSHGGVALSRTLGFRV